MSDVFESSRRKIARAKEHFAHPEREVTVFHSHSDYYEIFTEPHPNKPKHSVHKMRIAKDIPSALSEIAGDIVNNLRESLDHMMYSLACTKMTAPVNAYFPFSKDASHFEANMKGRCADVPQNIFPLLRSFEPYKGGNQPLWALNQVCVANKHKLLVPIGVATFSAGVNFQGTGYMQMPYPYPVWDSTKNEMELFTVAEGTTFNGNFKFGTCITFGQIEGVEGKIAVPVLDLMIEVVEWVLAEVAAESLRLGFIR